MAIATWPVAIPSTTSRRPAMRLDDQLAAVGQRAIEIEHDELHAAGSS